MSRVLGVLILLAVLLLPGLAAAAGITTTTGLPDGRVGTWTQWCDGTSCTTTCF